MDSDYGVFHLFDWFGQRKSRRRLAIVIELAAVPAVGLVLAYTVGLSRVGVFILYGAWAVICCAVIALFNKRQRALSAAARVEAGVHSHRIAKTGGGR